VSSWVRYCVAVYLGLLLAGTLVPPNVAESAGPVQRDDPKSQSEFTVPDASDLMRACSRPCERCGADQIAEAASSR
jgi:hypothetical protein